MRSNLNTNNSSDTRYTWGWERRNKKLICVFVFVNLIMF